MSEKEIKEKEEFNEETENTLGGTQNYVVQPIMLPILPASAPYLTETYNVDPSYSVSTEQLTVLMSFKIPGDVNPSQVSIKQYYNSNQASDIEFYAIYSSESTTDALKSVNSKFKACATDAAGNAIELGAILNVKTMLVNSVGPKSSRGTSSSVRVTGMRGLKE